MTNKRIVLPLVIFLVLLLVIPFSIAQPPFAEPVVGAVGGLQIDFNKFLFYPINENIEFNFHVYNSSNFLVDNTTTSCIFHFFNLTGEHLVEQSLDYDPIGNDFFFIINNNTIEELEFYSVLVNCNNSFEAGFSSYEFRATINGQNPSEENNILAIVFGIIATIIFFSVVGTYQKSLGLKIVAYAIVLFEIVNLSFLL